MEALHAVPFKHTPEEQKFSFIKISLMPSDNIANVRYFISAEISGNQQLLTLIYFAAKRNSNSTCMNAVLVYLYECTAMNGTITQFRLSHASQNASIGYNFSAT